MPSPIPSQAVGSIEPMVRILAERQESSSSIQRVASARISYMAVTCTGSYISSSGGAATREKPNPAVAATTPPKSAISRVSSSVRSSSISAEQSLQRSDDTDSAGQEQHRQRDAPELRLRDQPQQSPPDEAANDRRRQQPHDHAHL